MSNNRKAERTQMPTGRFFSMPHSVLDSKAYQLAGFAAKALLFDICRQHDGKNNGHLHCVCKWFRSRGWASNETIQRAKQELLQLGLLIETRKGGLNAGASRYAVTWLPIDNFIGLDIKRNEYMRGAWAQMNSLPLPENRRVHSNSGNSPVPVTGLPDAGAVLKTGANLAGFADIAVPANGNNECLPSARRKRAPVVGKKGASGVKSAGRRPASSQQSMH